MYNQLKELVPLGYKLKLYLILGFVTKVIALNRQPLFSVHWQKLEAYVELFTKLLKPGRKHDPAIYWFRNMSS